MRNKLAMIMGTVVLATVGLASAASAQTPTAVEAAFTDAETQITTVAGLGLAVVVVAIGLGIGVRLLVKWIRRAVSAA